MIFDCRLNCNNNYCSQINLGKVKGLVALSPWKPTPPSSVWLGLSHLKFYIAHHLLRGRRAVCAACARVHHTATNCCPDTHCKLGNTENQYHCAYGHLCDIYFVIVFIVTIIVSIAISTGHDGKRQAVAEDDYATKHCRCDGETHKCTRLEN